MRGLLRREERQFERKQKYFRLLRKVMGMCCSLQAAKQRQRIGSNKEGKLKESSLGEQEKSVGRSAAELGWVRAVRTSPRSRPDRTAHDPVPVSTYGIANCAGRFTKRFASS